jgi:hypothetical protein
MLFQEWMIALLLQLALLAVAVGDRVTRDSTGRSGRWLRSSLPTGTEPLRCPWDPRCGDGPAGLSGTARAYPAVRLAMKPRRQTGRSRAAEEPRRQAQRSRQLGTTSANSQCGPRPADPGRGAWLPALRAVKVAPPLVRCATGVIAPALCAVRFAPDPEEAPVGAISQPSLSLPIRQQSPRRA